MGELRTDETGLHSVDCECPRCEDGYRPTELERATARRALAIRRAAEARKIAEEAGKQPVLRPRLEPPRAPVPLTPEQWKELEELRKGLKK